MKISLSLSFVPSFYRSFSFSFFPSFLLSFFLICLFTFISLSSSSRWRHVRFHQIQQSDLVVGDQDQCQRGPHLLLPSQVGRHFLRVFQGARRGVDSRQFRPHLWAPWWSHGFWLPANYRWLLLAVRIADEIFVGLGTWPWVTHSPRKGARCADSV